MYPNASLFSTGTIQELRVCCDLLAQGYEVYRAVSSCAPFDLIASRDAQLVTIEVKSAYDRGGKKLWVPNPTKAAVVLAAVSVDRIEYEPTISSVFSPQDPQDLA